MWQLSNVRVYGNVLHCSEELQNTYARHLLNGKFDHSNAFVYLPLVLATLWWCERYFDDPKDPEPGERYLLGGKEGKPRNSDAQTGKSVLLPL